MYLFKLWVEANELVKISNEFETLKDVGNSLREMRRPILGRSYLLTPEIKPEKNQKCMFKYSK